MISTSLKAFVPDTIGKKTTFHRNYLSSLDDDGDECYSENSDESGKLNICYLHYTYGTTNFKVLLGCYCRE